MSNVMLVGIDLETGGLDGYEEINGVRVHGANYYPIIEFGVIVTTTDLSVVDKFSVGVRPTASMIEKMHPWAQEQHQKSGLLDALREGTGEHDKVAASLAEAELYIITRLEMAGAEKYDHKEKTGSIVFGNNVGFDMNFISAQAPTLASHFHYRRIDISSLDMLSRTAWHGLGLDAPKKVYAHTALSDIEESLKELNYYTDALIKE